MPNSFIELIVGNLEEKRAYRQVMKRVNALPKDYCFAFKKIQHYLYNFDAIGCDLAIYTELLELFEASAADNIAILKVTGRDVAAFCDDLILAYKENTTTTREKLHQEIHEYFHKEGA